MQSREPRLLFVDKLPKPKEMEQSR
jgi:hypothetical protein